MAATQYIGAKYVPHGWEEWNQDTYYDGLFCVSYNYSWFIAKQNVPVGISPVNTEYWAPYSLTTGAQQELVDLVNRYDPKEALQPGFDIDTLMEPGEYYFNNYKLLVGGPRFQHITGYSGAIKGTLSVRRCSDTFAPKNITIAKRLWLDMEFPEVYTSTQNNNSSFSPWVLESSSLFMTGAKAVGLSNVDVFEVLQASPLTRYYSFNENCANSPGMGNYFNVVQSAGQAFAFGGVGSKNTIATAYWSNSDNRWVGWETIPNSSYMNNLGFASMTITPVKTEGADGYYYYRIWRSTLNNVARSTMLTLLNDGGGHARIDMVKVTTGSIASIKIAGDDVDVEYSIGSSGEILIKSSEQWLDVKAISTNAMYGATASRSPIFNTAHNPYVMPLAISEPTTIPEL